MPKYKLIINNKKVYKSKAKNLEEFYNKVKNEIPKLIKYPHFWNLIYSPMDLPCTIAEKIIYFSRPYRYYLHCKNNMRSIRHRDRGGNQLTFRRLAEVRSATLPPKKTCTGKH